MVSVPYRGKRRDQGLFFLSSCFGFHKGQGHGGRVTTAWHLVSIIPSLQKQTKAFRSCKD